MSVFATEEMEKLGGLEMRIAKDFDKFSLYFEMIKNKPQFYETLKKADVPQFDFNTIKAVSVLAGTALATLSGAALGTASTGTAIATLSGAAATKATLALLGGGALAAGGGGIAAGTIALGTATLGVGLLIGGAVFAVAGGKIKGKAEEAYNAMLKNEREINKSIDYLRRVAASAERLRVAMDAVYKLYDEFVDALRELIIKETDWNKFTSEERTLVENNILIVSVLNKMINTQLLKVVKTDFDGKTPLETDIDENAVNDAIKTSYTALKSLSQ